MKKCMFVCSLLFAANACAAMVKWTDAEGNVHYSDKPPAGVAAQTLAPPPPPAEGAAPKPAAPAPAATGSAPTKLDDADAVPYLTAAGRSRYKEFLQHSGPRAFVICPDGAFSTIYGASDSAMNTALQKNLASLQGRGCKPYVVNDDVVWAG